MDRDEVYPDTILIIPFTHGGAALIALYRENTVYEEAFVGETEARARAAEVACDTFKRPANADGKSPILRVL